MRDRFWTLSLIVACLLVYRNGLAGPFLMDDYGAIVDNPTLRDLSDLGRVFSPPVDTTVAGRPILNLSFAINHAIGGLKVFGYHATNVALHLLASLALLGIVRRTLVRTRTAPWLAFPIALLWSIHPLQVQAVTYTVQRAESLMGLLLLATLYCAIRGMDSGRRSWFALATVLCALGMGTKEVMVCAPILVLLYDRTFVSGSFREALRERWALHAALASTWIVLAALVATNARAGSVGFGLEQVSAYDYALTQSGVLVRYLRLSVYPHPLRFDYAWPIAQQLREVAWPATGVGLLLISTFELLRRGSWLGFVGAWFFLILAPSSSVLPIVTEVAAEHRMYLPLAAPLTALVIGVSALLNRLASTRTTRRACGATLLALAACLLGWQTVRRNATYRSETAVWEDVVRQDPDNGRAYNSLAVHLMREGALEEAYRNAREALRLRPTDPSVHYNLGSILQRLRRPQEAAEHFKAVLRLRPRDPGAQTNLGQAFARLGRYEDALPHLRAGLADQPDNPRIHAELAEVLAQLGDREQALVHFVRLRELRPDMADRDSLLGTQLEQRERARELIRSHREALRLDPLSPSAIPLARLLATSDDPTLRDGKEALRLILDRLAAASEPTARMLDTLAAAYAETGRFEEALEAAERAAELATASGKDAQAERIRKRTARFYERGLPARLAPSDGDE